MNTFNGFCCYHHKNVVVVLFYSRFFFGGLFIAFCAIAGQRHDSIMIEPKKETFTCTLGVYFALAIVK